MSENDEKYNISLDIGTNSVGWCVTNEENEIKKYKDKLMWGTRLFEAGQSAEGTRIKRGQRRRYMRRRERIRLLQELMGEMIIVSDPNFFIRLEDAFLHKEDKRTSDENTLFTDKSYTDSDYYKEYPTIYHLRAALMKETQQADPRHIYLALHHIIKYRGHFLYNEQEFTLSDQGMQEGLEEVIQKLLGSSQEGEQNSLQLEELVVCLEKMDLTKKEKQYEGTVILQKQGVDKRVANELLTAIVGNSFDIGKLLDDQEIVGEDGKSIKLKFSDPNYEQQVEQVENILQERFEIIEHLHKLYSQYILQSILRGNQSLSEAMLARYQKHHDELHLLKKLVRTYNSKSYNQFFRKELDSANKPIKNYVNYIQGDKKCDQEALYKSINRILEGVDKNDPDYEYCKREINEGQFLSKLNSRDNSSIPWQLNEIEMRKIIENQSKYYPVLEENKEKIISLLSFRIPYYVGPLNPNSRFAWLKRTEEKMYPWNWREQINEEETAEAFITQMTNYCTYLPNQKVMPKNSLLYSRYCVLNELASIRINGKKLGVEDKQQVINNVFLHSKKVTEKKLIQWLEKEQWGAQTTFEITGYQKEKEFASSLGVYLDFYRIFHIIDKTNEEMIEQIIYWLTVFEEKEIIEKKLIRAYGTKLTKQQIKSILKLKYTGWSRLSRELLTGICVKRDEISYSIMDYLEQTQMNFMQIITHKELGFVPIIEERQCSSKGAVTLEDIKDLSGSPALKRGIWQSIRIIQEIIGCMGYEPSHIMIEVAREDQESKRTMNRKNKLLVAYETLHQEVNQHNEKIIKELKASEKLLNNEKIFLYFIQNGRCLYTNQPLSLNALEQTCEVDHIIPRCYIKDDSIENKALVLKQANQRKKDNLLLNHEIQGCQRTNWQKLHKCGLMGHKKYNNLMRQGLSEHEQKGFINRQLVETRQICKEVTILLQSAYVNTQIVLVKAELSYLFRKKYDLYKIRALNDAHHAHDAYIASVIGSTLLRNKECNSAEWIYEDFVRHFRKDKEMRNQKQGYILSMFDRMIVDGMGEVVWEGAKSIEKVVKRLQYKNYLITKKLEEGTGAFYDETIYPAMNSVLCDKKDLVPLKRGLDPKKYGGYNGVKNAYSVAIAYRKKKRIEKKLIGIPVQVAYEIRQGKQTLEDYIIKQGYDEVTILRERVLKYQLMENEQGVWYCTSHQEVCNAKQLYIEKRYQAILEQVYSKKRDVLAEYSGEIDELYTYLIEKFKTHYNGYKSVWEQVDNKIVYQDLSEGDKKIVLQELLKVSKADASNANLKRVNPKLGDRIGRKQGQVDLTGAVFIDHSVTGLFEHRVTL